MTFAERFFLSRDGLKIPYESRRALDAFLGGIRE